MKSKNIFCSFKYAKDGIISSILSERNMKVHVTVSFLVILCGLIFQINKLEWITCIICIGLVLSCEMINTSIEHTVNLAMPKEDPIAKAAKDTAAGAVLVLAISSAIIGLIIFIPKLINILN